MPWVEPAVCVFIAAFAALEWEQAAGAHNTAVTPLLNQEGARQAAAMSNSSLLKRAWHTARMALGFW